MVDYAYVQSGHTRRTYHFKMTDEKNHNIIFILHNK